MKPLARIGVFLATAFIVSSGVHQPLDVPLDSALAGSLLTNFHDRENGYRWTRAASSIDLGDLGGGVPGTLEVELSAFRPRGIDPPRVLAEVGGKTARLTPRRLETVSFEVVTPRDLWDSRLELSIRSETFAPGEWDRRPLGVRVHRVRLLPNERFAWSLPPLRLLVGLFLLLLGVFGLMRSHTTLRRSEWIATALGAGWLIWLLVDRLSATVPIWPLVALVGSVLVIRTAAPRLSATIGSGVRYALAGSVDGARRLGLARALVSTVLMSLSVIGLYRVQTELSVELGSGRGALAAANFSTPDQMEGKRYRTALRGAELSFPDHGSGDWEIQLTASSEIPRRIGIRTPDGVHQLDLSERWSSSTFQTRANNGWTSGPLVTLETASPEQRLRIHRLDMTRLGAWPSFRLLWTLCLISMGVALIATSCGITPNRALAFSVAFSMILSMAFALEPILMPPFSKRILLGVLVSWAFIMFVQGFVQALHERQLAPTLSPSCYVVSAMGIVAWFSALTYPLYVGGHFGFHSAIAEEIWQGKFLLYYLPYPGSMLARQPQWNDVIVPHSCLYHTLVAPLAAFPQVWFHTLEKLFLALLLGIVAVVCALAATTVQKSDGKDAGRFAALTAVSMPISFQLLGLGHLMTLFGVFAGALFLVFIIVQWEYLREHGRFRWGLLLLSLALVSYTATLLFTLIILTILIAVVWREDRVQAKRLFWIGCAASAVGLVLYYGNWVVPFVKESAPSLLGRATGDGGDPTPWLHRIGDIPEKLRYSFGGIWIPLLGLGGLSLARPGGARSVLFAWGSILPLFLTADLAFNFLLKHHYFTFPVVAIGIGLLASRWHEKGGLFRVGAWVGLGSIVLLGIKELIDAATGVVGVF